MFAFFSQTAGQSGTVRMTLAMTPQWLDARDNRDALVERSMFDAKGDALKRGINASMLDEKTKIRRAGG